MKNKIKAISLVALLALGGCSSDEDDLSVTNPVLPSENKEQVVVVENTSISVNESSSIDITYNIHDEENDGINVSALIIEDDGNSDVGSIIVGVSSRTITYTSPMSVSEDMTYTLVIRTEDPINSHIVEVEILLNVINSSNEDSTPTIAFSLNEDFVAINESAPLTEFSYIKTPSSDNIDVELFVNYKFTPDDPNDADLFTIEHDEFNSVIKLSSININKNVSGVLEVTVSDGSNESSDSITINLIDDINQLLRELKVKYDSSIIVYDSISDRNDELVIFDYYMEMANIINPQNSAQVLLLRDELLVDIEAERAFISLLSNDIGNFILDVNRNMSDIDSISGTQDLLETKINVFGVSSIFIINKLNERYLDNILPSFTVKDINKITIDNTNYYSRYIGDEAYGNFDTLKYNWSFNDNYKFLELINVLTTYCN